MYYRHKTPTKVAAIICCILTGFAVCGDISKGTNEFYGRGYHYAPPEAKIPGYVFWIVSDVLCLIGTHKNKKYLLLPFIIKTSLSILGIVLYLIFMIYLATLVDRDHSSVFLVVITLLFGMLGLFIYFLVASIKCFQEMSGVISGRSVAIVLQPISSQPNVRTTEVGNYHLRSSDQNQTYGFQEQPPAYHSKDYARRNEGMKSDYSSNPV